MKLLLAYDGEAHSQAALEEAARVASEGGASVTVIGVVTPAESPSHFGTGPRPRTHDHVASAHAYLLSRGVESEMKVEQGEAADEILREAEAGGYDLIVTGTRGHGPVARLVLGSVSRKVAEHALCPVTVVGEQHRLRVEPSAAGV